MTISRTFKNGQVKCHGLYEWQCDNLVSDDDPMFSIVATVFLVMSVMPAYYEEHLRAEKIITGERQAIADLVSKHMEYLDEYLARVPLASDIRIALKAHRDAFWELLVKHLAEIDERFVKQNEPINAMNSKLDVVAENISSINTCLRELCDKLITEHELMVYAIATGVASGFFSLFTWLMLYYRSK
jgi:hypothetical protein